MTNMNEPKKRKLPPGPALEPLPTDPVKLPLALLKKRSEEHQNPDGYVTAFTSAGEFTPDGLYLKLTFETYQRLNLEFRHKMQKGMPKELTVRELATNFGTAISTWASKGFKVVSKEDYDKRAAICNACPLWDATARMGLGRCGSVKCGCTKFKRWLYTEKCPEGKWPEITQTTT
jgi:hypothetical protein